jgi:predicted DNA-binding transcriptional regulator AlpA
VTAPLGALGVNDAAKFLGISRRSMYRLTAECGTGPSQIPVVHIGGRRVFRVRDLQAFLDRNVVAGGRRSA